MNFDLNGHFQQESEPHLNMANKSFNKFLDVCVSIPQKPFREI